MNKINIDNTSTDTLIKSQAGFLISRIKQVGGRVFERILSEKNIDAFNGAQGRILYVLCHRSIQKEKPQSTFPSKDVYSGNTDSLIP